ncbi:MAG: CcdB family protein [Gammaproteobacteria bacterium]|nr:CcdB family protein [Gammaproteobacteria bacterium]
MPQFTVYRNKNPQTRSSIPFLLDVQSDLLSELNTRVVVPMYLHKTLKTASMTRLTPEVTFAGKKLVLMTPQLAGIAVKDLGDATGNLGQNRDSIIGALDLLFTGV